MKLLLYCTKSNKKLFYDKVKQAFMYGLDGKNDKFNSVNGKVVAECDFEVKEFDYRNAECLTHKYLDLLNKSCLTDGELFDYLEGKNGYTINIKNLHIFDEPKELSDYNQLIKGKSKGALDVLIVFDDTKKAPQNMMYVYDKNTVEKKVLISIRPEWLCKILNGEKTIEVRKKVLREMLND